MLRAAGTGFLLQEGVNTLHLSRPVSDSAELEIQLPWIDPRSRLCLESDADKSFLACTSLEDTRRGLHAEADFYGKPGAAQLRLHGNLQWNASSPFSLANPVWIYESMDAPVEAGEALAIDTTTLLADLPMRWPRLAGCDSTEQRSLAAKPDSVTRLLDDWRALNLQRKRSPQVKVGATLADTSRPWQELDTTSLRRILQDSLRAFVAVQVGDTLHPALYSWNFLVFDLDSPPTLPYFVDQRQPYAHWPPSPWNIRADNTAQYPPSWYKRLFLRVSLPFADDSGSVEALQITGSCPAFQTWRQYGFSNRLSRPHGNLDPLDGYLCLLKPHRINFPLAPAASYRHSK